MPRSIATPGGAQTPARDRLAERDLKRVPAPGAQGSATGVLTFLLHKGQTDHGPPLVPTTGEMRTHKTRHDHTAECFVVYGAEDVNHTEGLMLPLCLKTCNENMQYP